MSFVTMRLLRVVVLAALLGASLAVEPPHAAAQELDGNVFTDPVHGWSVEFDELVWEAEEVLGGGVLLSSGSDAAARLIVYEDGITDAGDCLDDLDRAFTSNDAWDDLTESRRLDPPATASDAEGRLYTGALVAVDPEIDVVLYLECHEVADATLSISIWVEEDRFEDMLPDLEDLLAAVETDGPVQDNGSSGDDGIVGATYTNAEFGFVVEWDDREWTVDDPANFIGIEFSREVRDGSSYGGVSVRTDIDGTDAEACVDTIRGELERDSAISELDDAPRLDLPETDADAFGAVFDFVYTLDGDELELVSYVECRALSGGEALVVRFTADAASYEDQLEDVAGFLAGIQVDSAGTQTDGDEETPEPDGGDDPVGEDGLSGNVYVSTEYGWSVEFDDAVWQEVEEIDEPGRQGISLGGGDAFVNLIVFPEGEPEPDACLDDLELVYTDTNDLEDVERARTLDPPATSRDAVGALYTGSIILEDGDLAIVIYLECRGVDGGALTFVATVAEESYEDLLPEIEALLAGIETGD